MDTLPQPPAPVYPETIDPDEYAIHEARCALADLSCEQIRALVREIMAERKDGAE